MVTRKVLSAAELEQMSPNDRQAAVRAGVRRDLDGVSPDVLDRVREKVEAHMQAAPDVAAAEQ